MTSPVRVLPTSTYMFNTVPICDPGGPNPHGLVWETFPAPVRDFTPRLYYFRETRFPKPDSGAGFRRRTHSELGYLPIRLQIHSPIPWTNPFTIRSFSGVPHYYWDVGLLLDSLPKPDSEAGLTQNWAISQFVSKYTVLFPEPIRSLLDPFRVSHTIIGTSDDREGYRGQYPPLRLYLGPDGRLALQPVIRVTNWSPNDMGMYVYISQRKYIPYLTSIHALSPYELSHTITSITCVIKWFNHCSISSSNSLHKCRAISSSIYNSSISWLQSL